jgi:hypothetical protein
MPEVPDPVVAPARTAVTGVVPRNVEPSTITSAYTPDATTPALLPTSKTRPEMRTVPALTALTTKAAALALVTVAMPACSGRIVSGRSIVAPLTAWTPSQMVIVPAGCVEAIASSNDPKEVAEAASAGQNLASAVRPTANGALVAPASPVPDAVSANVPARLTVILSNVATPADASATVVPTTAAPAALEAAAIATLFVALVARLS